MDPICLTQTTKEETTTRAENEVISIILGVAIPTVVILVLGICIICCVKRKFWPTKGKLLLLINLERCLFREKDTITLVKEGEYSSSAHLRASFYFHAGVGAK